MWPPTSPSPSTISELFGAPGQTLSSGLLPDLNVDGAGVVSDLLQVGLALAERREDPGETGLTALCGLKTGPGVGRSSSGHNLH